MLVTELNWELQKDKLGGKAAQLFKLRSSGVQVPPLIALSTAAFEDHIKQIPSFLRLLADTDYSSPLTLRESAQRIREIIIATPHSPEMESVVLKSLYDFFPSGTYLSVRSSALGEDSAALSFAGQMDSFLFINGANDVLDSIKKCWASLFSDRALTYRKAVGLGVLDAKMAVVIQEMIEGEISGVAFSVNPLSNRRSELLITSTFGAGEGIVSGALDTDQFVLDRSNLKTLNSQIVQKEMQIVFNRTTGIGTCEEKLPDHLIQAPSLKVQHLEMLGNEILRIEEIYEGKPQDIEWTIAQDQLFILQSRPITTLAPAQEISETQRIEQESSLTIWDNSNIVESYSGVTTPLTFTFANHCYYMVYVQFCEVLGVPREKILKLEPSFKNMLGLLRGRIYYNLINWCRLISVLPGYHYNREFMEQMMGVKDPIPFEEEAQKDVSLFRKYFIELPQLLLAGVRLFYRFMSLDRDVKKFIKIYEATYRHYKYVDFKTQSLHQIVNSYNDMETRVLRNWKPPIVNDFMAMIFYGLLKKMILRWKLDESGAGLQNELLSDQGDVESTLPIKKLQEITAYLRTRPDLKTLILQNDETRLKEMLLSAPAKLSAAEIRLQEMLKEYLDEFGFRCMNELKLEEFSLKEKPEFIFTLLKNYLGTPELVKVPGEVSAADLSMTRALEQLKGSRIFKILPRSWVFRFLVHFSKKAIRVREYQRFARTKMFGLMRNLFKATGHKFAELGLLEQHSDIFYLSKEEIFGTISGTGITEDLSTLARMRREKFESYKREDELPDRINTNGIVLVRDLKSEVISDSVSKDFFKGTSCCPGKVRATVKVILNPGDDMSLNGEILVAARTDPGWVTLYPSAKGLLVERGSVLSHSAIVARELGLPAIVGIPQITKFLKTGDVVEMDGAQGTVKVISRLSVEVQNVREA